jgi:hypothetical protein
MRHPADAVVSIVPRRCRLRGFSLTLAHRRFFDNVFAFLHQAFGITRLEVLVRDRLALGLGLGLICRSRILLRTAHEAHKGHYDDNTDD